ncbi:unnamed protein product (macronuclear) [Paramecium tetraurelia]|uniref:Uncharacterized protein n=1 Tax=Paramecium tetraurelia TaxID=5888 RepID=A0BSW1_PARTE|nr:uncharacterized protein GSPATT00031860001 [Paramecium tetraurelia]CAK61628.1 unnamed protein product [Paramecium tetraurelia]|eukprot:XP_001429026.1 hypothetical protein (macronuclear) [Paramecium tetraurelia strain d4-2]
MNQSELSSDDLDQLFKGIQSKLEGKEDIMDSLIPKFQEKYKFFQIQESSKKLLGRFQLRLSELMEKCKNQNQFNYLVGIQQKLLTFNIIQILDQINNSGIENKAKDIVQQFRQPTNWQQNNKINKSLFQFYEDQFWRLYGILLLNEYLYIDFKRKHRKYDITISQSKIMLNDY